MKLLKIQRKKESFIFTHIYHLWCILILPKNPEALFIFFLYLSLFFNLNNFYWSIIKFTGFKYRYCIFQFLNFQFLIVSCWDFLSFHSLLAYFPLCCWTELTADLKFWSGNYVIWINSGLVSIDCLVFEHAPFSCFFSD